MSNAMCLEMKSKFGLIIFNPFVSIVYVSDSSHLFFFSFRQKFMKIFAIIAKKDICKFSGVES